MGGIGQAARLVVPELRKKIADPGCLHRMAALEAVWWIERDKTVVAEFRTAIRGQMDEAIGAAAILGELGADADEVVPDLIKLLWNESSGHVGAEAIGRIGRGGKSAIPALIRVLQDKDLHHSSYSSAAEALGLFGAKAKAAVPALVKLLDHPEILVKAHAALALWRIDRNSEGKKALALARHSRKYAAYITALEAEWLMERGPETIRDLIQELRDAGMSNDPAAGNRRYMAARALGRVGPLAKDALPDLKELLFIDDPILRGHVAAVVAIIEGKK